MGENALKWLQIAKKLGKKYGKWLKISENGWKLPRYWLKITGIGWKVLKRAEKRQKCLEMAGNCQKSSFKLTENSWTNSQWLIIVRNSWQWLEMT